MGKDGHKPCAWRRNLGAAQESMHAGLHKRISHPIEREREREATARTRREEVSHFLLHLAIVPKAVKFLSFSKSGRGFPCL